MPKAFVINGSPRRDKGNTAMVLSPLLEGMRKAGCEVDVTYAKGLNVRSCNCHDMYCWYNQPGHCCIKDDMEQLYPRISEADILIIATPVYIPLPGELQNVINRLCPLIIPQLNWREGRTRAKFRRSVKTNKILLVSSGGWWEDGNFDTVIRIVEELAKVASVEFSGAVIRPHASLMMHDGKLTDDGQEIVDAAKLAGRQLIADGNIPKDTLDIIRKPLIPEEQLRRSFNQLVAPDS